MMRVSSLFAVLGTGLAVYVAIFKSEHTPENISFLLFFVVAPWLVLDGLFCWLRWPTSFLLCATLMFLLELAMFLSVFVYPKSSTAALAYVVKPFIQLLIVLPIGLVIGRLIDRALDKTRAGV